MKCPKCGKEMVMENLDPEGKTKRVRCQSCGYFEVKDDEGRKMLTDDMPVPPPESGAVVD